MTGMPETNPLAGSEGRTTTALACRSVAAGYFGKPVLEDVSFEIHEPAVYVVLGPNGAGKTTLFRTLSGILPPTQGTVTVGGAPIDRPEARDRMHYLSHLDGIPDGLRVREAIEFYARIEGAGTSDVERVLDLLEIRELSGQFLSKLSAGQKKRVSVARVFLQEREIYLLDEPTSSLDPKVAKEIRTLILGLSRDKIVLYSSHNLYEAREIGRYVLAIKNGRLQLFDRMENLRGARYVIGVRLVQPSSDPVLSDFERSGDYYLKQLPGPDSVPDLIHALDERGLKIREVREMNNPLEDLFD